VSLELGLLNLVSTIEELLERKSSGSGLEIPEYRRGNPLRCPRTPSIRKSLHQLHRQAAVSIVLSRTKAMEFSLVYSA
jgi:hypothetical protein